MDFRSEPEADIRMGEPVGYSADWLVFSLLAARLCGVCPNRSVDVTLDLID